MEDVMNTTDERASLNPYAGWFFGCWVMALLVLAVVRSGTDRQEIRHQVLARINNQSVTNSQTKL